MKTSLAFSLVILFLAGSTVDAGASCSCNCNGGGENHCSKPVLTGKRNIKQCFFNKMNENKDVGLLKTCSFVKAESETSLRVTFQGVLRVIGCSGGCCRRWYLTINGKECTAPGPIDATIYADGTVNRHSPGTLDGFCDNIPKGDITVGILIASCASPGKGDGYTGWESTSRLIIEEVPPLQ